MNYIALLSNISRYNGRELLYNVNIGRSLYSHEPN